MRRHRRLATVIVLLLIPVAAAALQPPTAPATQITGVYYCEGTNGDGSPYHGLVTITRKGESYYLWWDLQPAATALGLGLREGDTLAVSYYGHNTGVIVYRIQGNRLVGRWTVPGADGPPASETLTPVDEAPRPRPEHTPVEPGSGTPIRLSERTKDGHHA